MKKTIVNHKRADTSFSLGTASSVMFSASYGVSLGFVPSGLRAFSAWKKERSKPRTIVFSVAFHFSSQLPSLCSAWDDWLFDSNQYAWEVSAATIVFPGGDWGMVVLVFELWQQHK